jgi:hypothetical protein
VHSLNLPCTFTDSGHQSCLTSLCIPTVNSYYHSQLDFLARYNLPLDVLLGGDQVAPCQPVLVEDHSMIQQPHPTLLDGLLSPHYWYPIAGLSSCLSVNISCLHTFSTCGTFTKLQDSDIIAWDALSSFLASAVPMTPFALICLLVAHQYRTITFQVFFHLVRHLFMALSGWTVGGRGSNKTPAFAATLSSGRAGCILSWTGRGPFPICG